MKQLELQIDIKKVDCTSENWGKKAEWYWELYDLSNNFIVCRSCNYRDINNPGDYTDKKTAIQSAKRFVKRYLSLGKGIYRLELFDVVKHKVIFAWEQE